jgi:hypothetical protein
MRGTYIWHSKYRDVPIMPNGLTKLNPQIEKENFVQEIEPNKKSWSWKGRRRAIFVFIPILIILGVLLYEYNQPYPLNGQVSIPSTVKQGDQFDLNISLTNPTTKTIFIKHIVLHKFLDAPALLNGARIVSSEPAMDVETLMATEAKYSYFREIKPGETQTVSFHMHAENVGVYTGDVAVYAKHSLFSEPAFQVAFYFSQVKLEISPDGPKGKLGLAALEVRARRFGEAS